MPFAFAGHCYATTGEALGAFQASLPMVSNAVWMWHASSSVDAAGVLSYSVKTHSMMDGSSTTRSLSVQLVSCSTPDAPAFDPVAAGGVFAFFFLGVAGTWLLSQNLGLILEAVKKW